MLNSPCMPWSFVQLSGTSAIFAESVNAGCSSLFATAEFPAVFKAPVSMKAAWVAAHIQLPLPGRDPCSTTLLSRLLPTEQPVVTLPEAAAGTGWICPSNVRPQEEIQWSKLYKTINSQFEIPSTSLIKALRLCYIIYMVFTGRILCIKFFLAWKVQELILRK